MPPPPSGTGNDDLRQITQIQLLRAKSRRLSARLANLTELSLQLDALGKDPKQEIAVMRKQRSDVAGQLLAASTDARFSSDVNLIHDRLTITVNNIGDLLWPWSVLELPTMREGINDIPQAPQISGQIATAGLFQGTGAWGGTPENDGPTEQWWVHNWTCTAVLPPAPHGGTVSYKFGANNEANVYHTEGSGTLTSFITVGTASDSSQQITDWQTVGWPFDSAFPEPHPILGGGASVVGSVNVAAGHSAAITIITGVVVSVTDGYIMFLPDSFGIGLLGQTGSAAYGKLQYRFNPQWVIEGVNEALR